MEGLDLISEHAWKPLSHFGLNHWFFDISSETVLFTWATIAIITILACIARYYLSKPTSIGYTLIIDGVAMIAEMTEQAVQKFEERYCIFIGAIFIYIFCCNIIMIIPGCEEPTKNINTTLALAIISFLYTQKESFRAKGFINYSNEFMKIPFATKLTSYNIFSILFFIIKIILNTVVAILTFPLELMSKLASVISLSFRLYGNIFGGAVIMMLWRKFLSIHYVIQILGLITGLNLILIFFFGLFEGFIQAFVFATLSITYLGIGLSSEH